MIMENEYPKAEVVSVEELFKKHGPKLRIPAYQRDFAWKSEQLAALCKDILGAVADKRREYHIGTLILHKRVGSQSEWFDIVDGQQRLTSICIILNDINAYGLAVESADDRRAFGKIEQAKAEVLQMEVEGQGINIEEVKKFLPQCTFVVITVENVEEAFQLFDTQNGRGKPLAPDNLLKAYHFHEMTHDPVYDVTKSRQCELETAWENLGENGRAHLIGEHLFRLRRWCRGEEAFSAFFSNEHLGEFKGVTLGDGHDVPPCHSLAFLRRFFRNNYARIGLRLDEIPSRLENRDSRNLGVDPFQSITQPIVNGEEFFLYVLSWARAHEMLFGNEKGTLWGEFSDFYERYCKNYAGCWNLGDIYSKHVFESLCLVLFDRFGERGLMGYYPLLYRIAYWERSGNQKLWRKSAGKKFAKPAIWAMLASETFAELNDAFGKLRAVLNKSCQPGQSRRWPFERGWQLVNDPDNEMTIGKVVRQ